MQNMEQKNNNDFMIEKIKERPVNKRKLLRRTLTTAMMAVIFGLIACFTFLVLEPVISNWLYPEPEEEQIIIFPEEQEEMEPEDMLSDNLPVEETSAPETTPLPEATPHPFASDDLATEKLQELIDDITLDANHYAQLYSALGEVVKTFNKYMVTITATESNMDWLANEYESQTSTMGVVIGNNGKEVLVLTNLSSIANADTLDITISTGATFRAQMKQYHTKSDIAILAVNVNQIGSQIKDIYVASFGSTSIQSLLCTPVIAMGCPMGECGTVGYGMITSENNQITMVDANYEILRTDIYGSQHATGFLFNLKGQIIGVITNQHTTSDMKNMITAYGISDLRKLISKLSGGSKVPYLGITGISVSKEANEEGQVPLGVYVEDVAMDSPAMQAGIQRGDVIVGMGNKVITGYVDYASAFSELDAGTTVTLKVMRQFQNEYKEMDFDILLEAAN